MEMLGDFQTYVKTQGVKCELLVLRFDDNVLRGYMYNNKLKDDYLAFLERASSLAQLRDSQGEYIFDKMEVHITFHNPKPDVDATKYEAMIQSLCRYFDQEVLKHGFKNRIKLILATVVN